MSPINQVGPVNVINLSQFFRPTQPQLTLLGKGLAFIPTNKLEVDQKKQMSLDLQTYHRRLKLSSFFEGRKDSDPLPFMPKSDWVPRTNQLPRAICNIIRADQYALSNLHWDQRDTLNLSPDEISALNDLQRNKQIVLKPVDKGSSIVILDRTQYIWEAERQLNNQTHYIKLKTPIFQKTIPMVEKILDNLQEEGHINFKQKTYLKGPGNPCPCLFYLLPKIHKDPSTWPKPFKIPPGCSSET